MQAAMDGFQFQLLSTSLPMSMCVCVCALVPAGGIIYVYGTGVSQIERDRGREEK